MKNVSFLERNPRAHLEGELVSLKR